MNTPGTRRVYIYLGVVYDSGRNEKLETLPLDLFQQSADSPALVLFKHGFCNIHWGRFQERGLLTLLVLGIYP
jgi:hypothetical protein